MLTGFRLSEIQKLRWEYVDLGAGELRLRDAKTGARTVHLSPSAVHVVHALPRKTGNPWVIPGNKPRARMIDIDRAWETIRARARLHDVRIHDIRHSCALTTTNHLFSLTIIFFILIPSSYSHRIRSNS